MDIPEMKDSDYVFPAQATIQFWNIPVVPQLDRDNTMSTTTTSETEVPNENLLQTVQTSPRQREGEDVKFFKNELVKSREMMEIVLTAHGEEHKDNYKEKNKIRSDKDAVITILETQLKYEREKNAQRYKTLQTNMETGFQKLTDCIKDKRCEAPEPAPPQTAPQPPSPPRRDSDWWRCW